MQRIAPATTEPVNAMCAKNSDNSHHNEMIEIELNELVVAQREINNAIDAFKTLMDESVLHALSKTYAPPMNILEASIDAFCEDNAFSWKRSAKLGGAISIGAMASIFSMNPVNTSITALQNAWKQATGLDISYHNIITRFCQVATMTEGSALASFSGLKLIERYFGHTTRAQKFLQNQDATCAEKSRVVGRKAFDLLCAAAISVTTELEQPVSPVVETTFEAPAAEPVIEEKQTPPVTSSFAMDISADLPADVNDILCILNNEGYATYLVGGATRDLYSGSKPSGDFDLVTTAPVSRIARICTRAGNVGQFHGTRHAVYRITDNATTIEISWLNSFDTSLPQVMVKLQNGISVVVNRGNSILEDAQTRDFSVNALYWRNGILEDPLHACKHIAERALYFIRPVEEAIKRDPFLILRALRFSAKLGFSLRAEDTDVMKAYLPLLALQNRLIVNKEISKTLQIAEANIALRLLEQHGIFSGSFAMTADSARLCTQRLLLANELCKDFFDYELLWCIIAYETVANRICRQLDTLPIYLADIVEGNGNFLTEDLIKLGIPPQHGQHVAIILCLHFMQLHGMYNIPLPPRLTLGHHQQAVNLSLLVKATSVANEKSPTVSPLALHSFYAPARRTDLTPPASPSHIATRRSP